MSVEGIQNDTVKTGMIFASFMMPPVSGEGRFLFDPFEQGRHEAGLFFSNVNESVFRLPVGSLIPSRFPMFQITAGDLRIVPDDQNVFTVEFGG